MINTIHERRAGPTGEDKLTSDSRKRGGHESVGEFPALASTGDGGDNSSGAVQNSNAAGRTFLTTVSAVSPASGADTGSPSLFSNRIFKSSTASLLAEYRRDRFGRDRRQRAGVHLHQRPPLAQTLDASNQAVQPRPLTSLVGDVEAGSSRRASWSSLAKATLTPTFPRAEIRSPCTWSTC